ncbi:MAG TPA: hypothetical protein VF746_02415 [Longimicrobium sp.]|jgi:hypothetical protein
MNPGPDITVYAPDRGVLLVAEVTTEKGTSPEWAAELRSELLQHMPIVGTAPYFLIAVPSHFFVWRTDRPHDADALPDYVVDARPFLGRVVDLDRVCLDKVTRLSLEMIVATWLQLLTRARRNGQLPDERQEWLLESGLLDTIKGGSVRLAETA